MPNSWRFLLVLLILSRILDLTFPLDPVVFLHFYFFKNADDVGWFSLYHRGNQVFLLLRFPLAKKVRKISSSLCLKTGHRATLTNSNIYGQS